MFSSLAFSTLSLKHAFYRWLLAALVLRLLTAYFNYGFVALDDYSDMIAIAVPAQNAQSMHDIVTQSGLRSPLPRLALRGLSELALNVGFVDPLSQIRFIYFVMALFSLISVYSMAKIFLLFRKEKEAVLCTALNAMLCIAPFFSTRSMVETWSAPFLSLSVLALCTYWIRGSNIHLIMSILWLALASSIRFPLGVGIAAIAIVAFRKSGSRAMTPFIGASLGGFLFTGLTDFFLRGSFHESLRLFLNYNIKFSSTHGTSPPLTFSVLLSVAVLLPFFIPKPRTFSWKKAYTNLFPALTLFIVILIAHEITPHKEPRFISPLIPLFLLLLTPLALHQITNVWRVRTWLVINSVLLLLSSFTVAQNNIVGLARFFHTHTIIQEALVIGDSLVLYPKAYSLHNPNIKIADTVPLANDLSCTSVLVARVDKLPAAPEDFFLRSYFGPGPLEQLIIALNRHRNLRRNGFNIFQPLRCR